MPGWSKHACSFLQRCNVFPSWYSCSLQPQAVPYTSLGARVPPAALGSVPKRESLLAINEEFLNLGVHRRGWCSDIFVGLCIIDSAGSSLELLLTVRHAHIHLQKRSHGLEKGWETLHLWVMISFELSIQWNVFTCHYSLPILPLHMGGGGAVLYCSCTHFSH